MRRRTWVAAPGALILLAACLLVYHAASRNDAVTVEERERRLQEAMPDGSWTIVHETEVEGYLLSGARGGRGPVSYTHLISKLTSEAYTQGRENEKRKIFRTAIWLFFALGLVGSLLMFFQADLLAVSYTHLDVYKRQTEWWAPR